ncbi:MAG TPA: hypothetical protein VGW38_22885 [Chloroflexota bacterium]|nr:hypothetical protein [Chloroflexota bacterium]
MELPDAAQQAAVPTPEQTEERQTQLAYINAQLAQWDSWRRKRTTVRPPISREYLESWRAQLLAEEDTDDERRAA